MSTSTIYRRYFAPRKNQVEFEFKTSNSCQAEVASKITVI